MMQGRVERKRRRQLTATACACVVVLAITCSVPLHLVDGLTHQTLTCSGTGVGTDCSTSYRHGVGGGGRTQTTGSSSIYSYSSRRTNNNNPSRAKQRTSTSTRMQWAATSTVEQEQAEAETKEASYNALVRHNLKQDTSGSASPSVGSALPPPWLERYEHEAVTPQQAQQEVEWLKYALREQRFSGPDILQVTRALETVAGGDSALVLGMVDFLRLLLRLVVVEKDKDGDNDIFRQSSSHDVSVTDTDSHQQGFVSKQVLLASILHYAECIAARREGLQDWIRDFLDEKEQSTLRTQTSTSASTSTEPFCSPYQRRLQDVNVNIGDQALQVREPKRTSVVVNNMPKQKQKQKKIVTPALDMDDEVLEIAQGAARIKRAEILAHAVVHTDSVLTDTDASRLRGLLLSVMDDWRSLAIRCVACLYRLEGILHHTGVGSSQYMERTPEMVKAAREAVRVYATLAQRLGMHRLKSAIEERAFRILYRRQYSAVSSLYRGSGEAMYSVSTSLLSKITQTLHQDESLMAQLDDLQVTSRVKEPYSFWKKLLKTKHKAKQLSSDSQSENDSQIRSHSRSSLQSDPLAITVVQDAVALRVILKARKWKSDEPDETTRARERLLCYYVQHLIRSKWPALEADRFKDYIQFPKSNGYQSLHYTSSITSRGIEFPFEVQVRSDEMHRLAEFGVAAHWDYKLGNESAPSTASITALPVEDSRSIAGLLPSASSMAQKESPGSVLPIAERGEVAIVGSYVDALVTAKRDMMQQTVYVFLAGETEGKLISLPTNSRVRDAITALDGQSIIGPDEPKVWLNGRTAYLDDSVVNGDLLLVT
jgi:ppGpp synthetase/RelA/SpoT-type nucleotidyltranferase